MPRVVARDTQSTSRHGSVTREASARASRGRTIPATLPENAGLNVSALPTACARSSRGRKATAPNSEVAGQDQAAIQRHRASNTQVPASAVDLGLITRELKELQAQRRFAIVSQSRCDRAVESYIARELGYSPEMDESDRKARFRQAGDVRRSIEKGNIPNGISAGSVAVVKGSEASRGIWDEVRERAERRMVELARLLPVYSFAKDISGFGDKGLAIIIAETGDLSNYDGPAKVWKRLGLAVIEGERQQRKTDKELAAKHGFNPKRRAEVWSIADSMFKHQWRGLDGAYREAIRRHPRAMAYVERDGLNLTKLKGDDLRGVAYRFDIEANAYPLGPYGELYQSRKAATEDRGWSDMRRDKDARRIMTKRLILNLWRVWNGYPPRDAGQQDVGLPMAA